MRGEKARSPDHSLPENGHFLPDPGVNVVHERQGRLHGREIHGVFGFDSLKKKENGVLTEDPVLGKHGRRYCWRLDQQCTRLETHP